MYVLVFVFFSKIDPAGWSHMPTPLRIVWKNKTDLLQTTTFCTTTMVNTCTDCLVSYSFQLVDSLNIYS